MSTIEQLNKLEIQINCIRREMITIISNINYLLSHNKRAIRTEEYKTLKTQYSLKIEEIYYLRTLKKELNNNSLAA